MPTTNLEIIQGTYNAFAAGDGPAAFANMAADTAQLQRAVTA